MNRKRETKYARVGETVRILQPKWFIRCGYPLTVDIVMEKYADEVKMLFGKAIEAIRPMPITLASNGDPTIDARTDQALRNAICYMIIRREGFGGKVRQIFEQEEDQTRITPSVRTGEVGTVIARKTVMTGTYSPASGGYSYDGDYDYDPAYLEDAKARVVYTLEVKYGEFITLATNCEKIEVPHVEQTTQAER